MNVSAAPPLSFLHAPSARAQREKAFAVARRHSALVKWLRALIVLVGVGGVAILVVMSILDPFRILPAGVTISRAGLNGTKVTMEQPRMAGFRKDGRAYVVNAASSVQDLRNPTKIDLYDITAKMAMADRSNATVTAQKGLYDTQKEVMIFDSDVHMVSESGYDLALKSGLFEFKASALSTADPVVLKMTTGIITANSMQIVENGQKITFEGNVVSVMNPPGEDAKPVRLKGSAE